MGGDYYWAFLIVIFCEILNMTVVMFLAHKIANLNLLQYTWNVIAPCSLLFVLAFLAFYYISENINDWYIKVIVATIVILIEFSLWLFVAIGKWERSQLVSIIKRR